MSILLNPELEQRIAVKVQSGRYRSPAEVIEEGLDLLEARDLAPQTSAAPNEPPIWETIVKIGKKIPEEEWAGIPTDLARNLDHYLYGSPKASE
ncbi:MAG: type II toxin-antitoxin system ParD family antitoxin [Terracidiphilus sp.]|jgi:Arc/MetJ-type ribon-helix-helix transcriptional regulator